ncbi:MAG: hypothetical protein ACXWPI_16840 [Ktedonobacterales bacterium]
MIPATRESIPPHDPVWPGWLAPCYQLTPRVQRLSATAALLDLGICIEAEAVSVVAGLLRRLENMSMFARVGIAPTATLAQLALLTAPSRRQIISITPQDAPRLVRHIPVAILSQLLPHGAITAEVVSRLQRYGLHTLGHVATLTESALRQQFGHAGGELAALAQGHDRGPFSPTTPSPQRLRFDMRLPTAVPLQQVLSALPVWAQQIAGCLKKANLTMRELQFTLGWERTSPVTVRTVLRQHTYDPQLLLRAIHALLLPLLLQDAASSQTSDTRSAVALLDTVHLTVLDVASITPHQSAFWQQRTQPQTALLPVADTLIRRHGHTLVLCARRVASDAIFPEERYRLHAVEPHTDEVSHGRQRVSVPSTSVRIPVHASGWEEVPHRLHWW